MLDTLTVVLDQILSSGRQYHLFIQRDANFAVIVCSDFNLYHL